MRSRPAQGDALFDGGLGSLLQNRWGGGSDLFAALSASALQRDLDQQQAMPVPDPDAPDEPLPGGELPPGDSTPPAPKTPNTQTLWFSYDAENRVQVVNGTLVNDGPMGGHIEVAAKQANSDVASYALHYDAAGHAVSRTTVTESGATQVAQSTYTLRGQLELEYATVNLGATTGVVAKHTYDGAGREIELTEYYAPGTIKDYHIGNPKTDGVEYYDVDVSGWRKHQTTTTYDNDGRVLQVSEFGRSTNGNATWAANYDPALIALSNVYYSKANGESGYDAAGRLTTYRYSKPSVYTHTYTTSYEARDTYLESSVYGSSDNTNYKSTTTTSTYDSMGRRTAIVQNTPYNGQWITQGRYFSYNGSSNILTRRDGSLDNYGFHESSNTRQYFSYVNGQQVAALGIDGSIDVASQLTAFDSSETGTEATLVLEGDTLQSIAQRVYGNSSLWYVLAAANAISDADLVAGTTLKAPEVKTTANDATTFKPYDPGAIEGPTTPSLPYITPPPKKHCNAVAMILIAVVAVVVTVFTAGAAAVAMGAAMQGSLFATGMAAMAGGLGAGMAGVAMGAAAIGGFVGSVASQAVGSALGVSSFSWRNAFVASATSAVSAGIGSAISSGVRGAAAAIEAEKTLSTGQRIAQFLTKHQWARAAVSGAAGTITNYAASKTVGNGASFSWRSIAASAVSAAITSKVGEALHLDQPAGGAGGSGHFGKDLANGMIGGAIGLHTRRAFGFDDPIDYGNMAVDAFGNALGNAVVRFVVDSRRLQKVQAGGRLDEIDPDKQVVVLDGPQKKTKEAIAEVMEKHGLTKSEARTYLDMLPLELQEYEKLRGQGQTHAAALKQAARLLADNPDALRYYKVEVEQITDKAIVTRIVGRVDSNDLKGAVFINGILNDRDRAVALSGYHMAADFNLEKGSSYYMIHNPSKGAFADLWEAFRDKIGWTTPAAQEMAGVFRRAADENRDLHIIAHSQGGAMATEAIRVAYVNSKRPLTGISITYHSGANNQWRTDSILKSAGVEKFGGLQADGYRDAPNDAVPQVVGLRAGSNIGNMLRSILDFKKLFSSSTGPWDSKSPHTYPYKPDEGLHPKLDLLLRGN